jgi:putative membrane protein
MIVRGHTNWFRMLFIWNGSVLPAILPQLILMLLVSSLALLTDGRIFGEKVPLDTAPFPLVGVSLAIFLAFRNNASYERYKEARWMWGHILVSARTLTSQALRYLPHADGVFDHELFMRRQIAFVYALKHQLRKTDAGPDLARYLAPDEVQHILAHCFPTIAMLDKLRDMLAPELHSGQASQLVWLLDGQIHQLSDSVGGCERISNTPIPYPYGVLLHRTVYFYCFLLPFGLVDAIGAATPLISVFVAYTLFALEAIAQQIAEPFGCAPNSLALDAMTRTIERSLLELCGEELPHEIAVGPDYQIR